MSELEPTRTYSNHTATDVLRRLLDERGVEHYDGTERTLWGYEQTGENTGIYRFAASEISGGFLQFDMFRITPEQAIAATLGAGTLTAEQVMAIAGRHQPDYCSDTHACFDWQAIADELNDTLGSCNRSPNCTNSERTNGACIPVLDSERDNQPYLKPRFVCSECGCQLTESRLGKVWQNYCPNCGRRIEQ